MPSAITGGVQAQSVVHRIPFQGICKAAAPPRQLQAWFNQPGHRCYAAPHGQRVRSVACQTAETKAVLFDCDGVILLSEDLHRVAYNAAFEHFDVRCGGELVFWSEEFYDQLQNTVGGGKPKMRWYFGKNGWPTSTVVPGVPEAEQDQATLVDVLQEWKTNHYQKLIASGEVPAREGVLRIMDETQAAGLKLGVCSAATKSSAVCVLDSLLGKERFQGLDIFLGGDDIERKKPDPSIYITAAERLGVQPSECVVIEDSIVGLKAAMGADMRCVITYTSSTRNQDFSGADRVIGSLGEVTLDDLRTAGRGADDRKEMQVAA